MLRSRLSEPTAVSMILLARIFNLQIRKNPLSINYLTGFRNMAQWTGLEPATPGVTGRYSNQLNYHCAILERLWWVMTGSNRRPSACKADALPAELITHVSRSGAYIRGQNHSWQALNRFILIINPMT